MEFIDKARRWFMSSDLLVRFVAVNVGVLAVLGVAFLCGLGVGCTVAEWTVMLPSDLHRLLLRPWTLLTYMFAHVSVWHLLFNMLWLYWLGRIFLEYFTPKQFGGLYVLGGLGGAVFFVAAYNLLPVLAGRETFLIGASASVLAIVVGVAAYVPDYKVNLLFWGGVSLKWIALIMIGMDVLNINVATDGITPNLGGHIAHLGGALTGLWFALAMRKGHDVTAGLNRVIDTMVSVCRGRKRRVGKPTGGRAYTYGESSRPASQAAGKGPSEAEIDRILGKLKTSGFDALSDEEKDTLFSASRKK